MSVRGRDLPTHTRGNSRGSDYVVESTTADTVRMMKLGIAREMASGNAGDHGHDHDAVAVADAVADHGQ